jgi:hypothetical protein
MILIRSFRLVIIAVQMRAPIRPIASARGSRTFWFDATLTVSVSHKACASMKSIPCLAAFCALL